MNSILERRQSHKQLTSVAVARCRLEDIMLTLFYSEFLTISTIVLLLISIVLAIILTFPIIMLLFP